MKRIIDANLNRAAEASRILEEIARFLLDDFDLSEKLKNIRHKICAFQQEDYDKCLKSRDTQNDVGVDISNPTKRTDVENIFKANIKRLQQALRTLAEYSGQSSDNVKVFEKLRYTSYTLEKIMWEKLKENFSSIKLSDKRLYLVTNSDKFETQDEFLDAVASALEGGVEIVQLREKTMSAKNLIELGKKVKQLCAQYGAIFIVNDRVDIAMILEADGVHLGQDDLDVKSARALIGEGMIIGVSTHAPEQALKAVEEGADYIGVGPVFETPTKQGRKAVGLDYVKWAAENIEIPFFAIGGIDGANVDKVLGVGAKRIAVVRAIINAKSPQKSAEEFLSVLGGKILNKI
ncbi:MAG TPA: thiamine phosphate synthase [Candidatus Gastranaerophilaceae bacterium]|nr:thiamine phosphate synthase [Candidatus Gastranaerophilaceae bacterium]HPT41397.1 thiamine phosphate synthase [Candidatus Gastranaerophilaceae bacterium]